MRSINMAAAGGRGQLVGRAVHREHRHRQLTGIRPDLAHAIDEGRRPSSREPALCLDQLVLVHHRGVTPGPTRNRGYRASARRSPATARRSSPPRRSVVVARRRRAPPPTRSTRRAWGRCTSAVRAAIAPPIEWPNRVHRLSRLALLDLGEKAIEIVDVIGPLIRRDARTRRAAVAAQIERRKRHSRAWTVAARTRRSARSSP